MEISVIDDDQMMALLMQSRPYTLLILESGPNRHTPQAGAIIREHGRRNLGLRADGVLSVVCPVPDESELDGVGIFNLGLDETRAVMEQDPGVLAGVFVFKLHPCRGFPGDALPA